MSGSTGLPAIPSEVLAAYGLLADDGWQLDHIRTLHNSVFSVRQRSASVPEWALRLHGAGWRTADEVRAELAMVEFLDQQLPLPISVPRPKRTLTGDLVVEVGGSRYSLLSWLPGGAARPDTGLDADGVRLLGRGLGAIHTALDRWTGPAPVRWDIDALFGDHAPGLMGKSPAVLHEVLAPADLALFADIKDRTREAFASTTDWGPIHADYILGNCHVSHTDGALQLGILDFDDFGSGPRPYDLAAALGNLRDFEDTWPTHAAAFVAGYRTSHELPAPMVAELPTMRAARHASMCLWIVGHTDLDRDHIQLRMQLARDCLTVDSAVVDKALRGGVPAEPSPGRRADSSQHDSRTNEHPDGSPPPRVVSNETYRMS